MVTLENKKILVLGASGFIGREVTLKISELGAKVIVSGTDDVKLTSVLSSLSGEGHQKISFDISDINKISDLFKSLVLNNKQRLDGMVFCPGIFPLRPLKSISPDFLHKVININFYSFVECVKQFSHKKISNPNSSIVSLSSYASINPDKGQMAYGASKSAMDASIKVMAKELKIKKIRINSIRPSALLPDYIKLEDLPLDVQKNINEMGTGAIDPENIAEQIAFLLSNSSKLLNGQSFNVRGYLQ